MNRNGFTIAELLFALLVGGLLVLALTRLADTVDRVGAATRAGSDSRALEWTAERVLRRALEEAGTGMPSSPNLGGVGARSSTAGTPLDTLVTLRADGDAMPVAARACRASTPAPCFALTGDQRGRLSVGDLLVVGARGTGMVAYQVTVDLAVFHAPCGGDCPERLVCPITAGPAQSFPRVVGSIRQPSGATSPAPCPHAVLSDGTRCEEVVQPVLAGVRHEQSCRIQAPSSAFTEVRVVERTTELGFLQAPVPLSASGAGATPKVRAVRVRAARFWVRAPASGDDSVLVRQNGLDVEGTWRAPTVVAGPITGLRIETLQTGVGWTPGIGLRQKDLAPTSRNPNYVWRRSPTSFGREPGSAYIRGYHTIEAVRIRYIYRTASPSTGQPTHQDAWMVVSTRSLLEGGTGDVR